jgi:hypothetical protein
MTSQQSEPKPTSPHHYYHHNSRYLRHVGGVDVIQAEPLSSHKVIITPNGGALIRVPVSRAAHKQYDEVIITIIRYRS